MNTPDAPLLAEVLRHAPDGVAVAEGVPPRISYVNATLAELLRQPEPDLLGRALDELEIESAPDTSATGAGIVVRVQLRRGDGLLVSCDRWSSMMRDGRVVLYYRPVQRAANGVPSVDRASGLATYEHLLGTLRRDWAVGQRDGRSVTLMKFAIDACREYHEVFGRVATENVMRQVGRTVASSMRRVSDVVARSGEDEFLALGVAMEQASAYAYAESIAGRVRALAIHHPRSHTGRFLTVSAGAVTAVPRRDQAPESLIDAVGRALDDARQAGGNRVSGGEA
jgi:diguanylate cyclase (GGDEF)-like protein